MVDKSIITLPNEPTMLQSQNRRRKQKGRPGRFVLLYNEAQSGKASQPKRIKVSSLH